MNQDPGKRQYLTRLRERLCAHFSRAELETLAFDLGLDHENFSSHKEKMARELISAVIHRSRLDEFIEKLKLLRPKTTWEITDAAQDALDDSANVTESLPTKLSENENQPPPPEIGGADTNQVIQEQSRETDSRPIPQPEPFSREQLSPTSSNESVLRYTVIDWWQKRQYEGNPFQYFDAEEVKANQVRQLESWWTRPNIEHYNKVSLSIKYLKKLKTILEEVVHVLKTRFHATIILRITNKLLDTVNRSLGIHTSVTTSEILDKIMEETTKPVIVYAVSGGGKTFYRRLSRYQLMLDAQHMSVEIKNPADYVEQINALTSINLVSCIYQCICQEFNRTPSYTSGTLFQWLRECDNLIAANSTRSNTLCYVLLDGLDQFFIDSTNQDPMIRHKDEMQNQQALNAIAELLRAVADRSHNHFALRIFLPQILRQHLRAQLGHRSLRHVNEISLQWDEILIMEVIENRLKSLYSETNVTRDPHLPFLLGHEAIPGLKKWFRQRESLSPGCAIRVMEKLIDSSLSYNPDPIPKEHCDAFLNRKVAEDSCLPDGHYAFSEKQTASSRSKARWHDLVAYTSHILSPILLLVRAIHLLIDRLAYIKDWIGAFLLLATALVMVIYVSSCLISAGHNLQECARHLWDIITRQLFGGS